MKHPFEELRDKPEAERTELERITYTAILVLAHDAGVSGVEVWESLAFASQLAIERKAGYLRWTM